MEDVTGDPYPEQRKGSEPALVTGLAYGLLALVGALLGLIGSFEFSWTVVGVPVAALGWAAIDLIAFRAAGWSMASRLGVAMPAAGWLIVVVVLASQRPEGDLVVTGTTAGYVFIFGGSAAAVAAAAWTRPARPWLPPAPDPPGPRR